MWASGSGRATSGVYAGHAAEGADRLRGGRRTGFRRVSPALVPSPPCKCSTATVRGWLLGDEPDMNGIDRGAAGRSGGRRPAPADPSRPTYVNFSKGIVNGWNNGGPLTERTSAITAPQRTSLPSTSTGSPTRGRAGPARRATRGRWQPCGGLRHPPIWAFVETTRPFDATRITPDQFEVAVWTLLASGADGIELFIHDFGPNGSGEDALLRDPAAAAVKARVGSRRSTAPRGCSAAAPGRQAGFEQQRQRQGPRQARWHHRSQHEHRYPDGDRLLRRHHDHPVVRSLRAPHHCWVLLTPRIRAIRTAVPAWTTAL